MTILRPSIARDLDALRTDLPRLIVDMSDEGDFWSVVMERLDEIMQLSQSAAEETLIMAAFAHMLSVAGLKCGGIDG